MLEANSISRTRANYEPLNPISFLLRTAATFPDKISVIYNGKNYYWRQTLQRCMGLAQGLLNAGLSQGDVVGVLAVNTPELYEAHFGIPMAGMILNALNCRLDPKTIAYIIDHSEIKLLISDKEFSETLTEALTLCDTKPIVIDIDDENSEYGELIGKMDYERFISGEVKNFTMYSPKDEWETISINYTSGTTGNPKGVLYHYRGAYLNAIGNTMEWDMEIHPVYLWTLPMFHCNGWCFPWTIAAKAGTNVCIRKVSSQNIYNCLAQYGVTHLCGAPIVLGLMVNAKKNEKKNFKQRCKVMTAAAPPPAQVLESMQKLGFDVTHVYGLTEVYGPCVVCCWKDEWNELSITDQAQLKSRQGQRYSVQEGLRVVRQGTMEEVPKDGKFVGEVLLRGNITMKGYLKDLEATNKAFENGWFHTGDLGVVHPDGYLQLRDRAKDIIISGGENISSIEIENCLYSHPAVSACGVVARPDDKWGETPCAFIELKEGYKVTENDIISYCRENLAGFKIPKSVYFQEIPKTSTGKVQKVELRKLIK